MEQPVLSRGCTETAGELHGVKGGLEARCQYSKGQSVKDWTKKVLYWKRNGSLTLEMFVLSHVLL